jgi:hypothetical protein
MTKARSRNDGTSPTIFHAFEMARASFDDILIAQHPFANSRIQNLHPSWPMRAAAESKEKKTNAPAPHRICCAAIQKHNHPAGNFVERRRAAAFSE